MRRAWLAFAVVCCLPAVALAVPTITAGNHFLLFETPGQVVPILVTSDDEQVPGLDLFLYVNNEVAPAPVITAVDIIGPGTIFNANNVGQFDLGDPFTTPGLQPTALTITASGLVPANGVLAFVTIDTTGVPAGYYYFGLTNPSLGPTDFATNPGSDAILIDGQLILPPEPASIVMGLFAAVSLGAVIVRRCGKQEWAGCLPRGENEAC